MMTRAVGEILERARMPYTRFRHRPAYTAQEKAAVSHIPGRSWAKRVVFLVDDEPVIAVVPAVDAAAEWRPDLIVIGSHGWKGLDRVLLGSVSDSVLRHVSCSVQVVRAARAA